MKFACGKKIKSARKSKELRDNHPTSNVELFSVVIRSFIIWYQSYYATVRLDQIPLFYLPSWYSILRIFRFPFLFEVLWEEERTRNNKEEKQRFVDLGCGNGLLVYLLSQEGVSFQCLFYVRDWLMQIFGLHRREKPWPSLHADSTKGTQASLVLPLHWLLLQFWCKNCRHFLKAFGVLKWWNVYLVCLSADLLIWND